MHRKWSGFKTGKIVLDYAKNVLNYRQSLLLNNYWGYKSVKTFVLLLINPNLMKVCFEKYAYMHQ